MTIRENEAVELRCVVHDAKPKATIVWFRENTEFITGKIQSTNNLMRSRRIFDALFRFLLNQAKIEYNYNEVLIHHKSSL